MGILLGKLTEYSNSDYYPYHMPGHKRNVVGSIPAQWTGTDITEIEGFDNLHDAQGVLKQLQEDAAAAYGAEESFYLVNGSTCGILSAISATVPFGGELLIVRNSHKSVYHGAYLRQLTLRYIYPQMLNEFEVCEAVTAGQVQAALEEYPNVAAVLIVSPTYEGRIADVAAIAHIVHANGLPLIVDEAHGAHLGFVEDFATNSCRLGADLVINSLHKTLPSMTQTALLHCNGNLVDRELLKRFLRIYQTSSPSYVLMASMEEAVCVAVENKQAFQQFADDWQELIAKLQKCQRIHVLPEGIAECAEKKHDIGKLVLSVKGTGLSGQQFYDILLEKYHLQMEMACESYVLAMFTIGDTKEAFERLAAAVLELDAELEVDAKNECRSATSVSSYERTAADTGVKPRNCTNEATKTVTMHAGEAILLHEAWDAPKELVPILRAQERMAGEFINLYPPGTPIAVPGERLTSEVIQMLQNCLDAGLTVQGIDKEKKVWVLRES